jgi:hypothetical protein
MLEHMTADAELVTENARHIFGLLANSSQSDSPDDSET